MKIKTDDKIPTSWFVMFYLFKILPVIVGLISIYLGYRLFILGVTGQASLSIESKTVSGQLLNAAPGLFFAIGGIVAVLVVVWKSVDIDLESALEENGDEGQTKTRNRWRARKVLRKTRLTRR